jgi:hypothetical protein
MARGYDVRSWKSNVVFIIVFRHRKTRISMETVVSGGTEGIPHVYTPSGDDTSGKVDRTDQS